MQKEILLEAAIFQIQWGRFETDITKGAAPSISDFDFWTVASQFDGGQNLAPLAQKLPIFYTVLWVMWSDATNS